MYFLQYFCFLGEETGVAYCPHIFIMWNIVDFWMYYTAYILLLQCMIYGSETFGHTLASVLTGEN